MLNNYDNLDSQVIRIRGARTHNLRGVDVDLPTGKLIVMTGVSGSGKSSLAFDTLFAEGQRRYLESVSTHTRSLLMQLPHPDVDEISGLPPTICVDQRTSTVPARTTLAVTSEVYDYLRLLYARAGIAHCTNCGDPVTSQSVEQIVHRTLRLPERSKLMILSPMVRARRGAHKDVVERIARNGFVRARIDGKLVDIAEASPLEPSRTHSIDAVIDRIILKEGIEQRLRESIELACRESDGTCIVCRQNGDDWVESFFSTRFSCPRCNLSFPTPEPRTFSFNSAWGACLTCQGFGIQGVVDNSDEFITFGRKICSECEGSRLLPFPRNVMFLGLTISELTHQTVGAALQTTALWLERLQQAEPAGGSVSVEDMTTATELSHEARLVALRTLPDIRQRLQCLSEVGLDYLTLDRATRTLSGGEFQRARLAACLGSGLHGACFVLDEPTAGLHPRDTDRLLSTLQRLRDNGATVVVVEHDGKIMKAADWLVDLGPGAGSDGGRLMFAGAPNEAQSVDSPTGKYLAGRAAGESDATAPMQQKMLFDEDVAGRITDSLPDASSTISDQQPHLTIRNATLNNLQDITARIPLNRLVCVTGVSGSGKSSLIMETLLPVMQAACRIRQSPKHLADHTQELSIRQTLCDVHCHDIDGLEAVSRVVSLDSRPIGRSSRSCIVTITGIWNIIRQLFTKTRESRARGFGSTRFSFNSGDGRCGECKGTGIQNLQMSFLPNVAIDCPTCRGQRFNRATLSVHFNGRSVADVLQMRVDEACDFFCELSRISSVLQTLKDVGLGYLKLGQPSSTYSGGEAQRVRLVTELTGNQQSTALYILDEPTSGLHPADVGLLIRILRQLVQQGHSVIVVEHQLDLIKAADWVIDVGPESGKSGGQVIAAGSPDYLIKSADTHTAKALREHG